MHRVETFTSMIEATVKRWATRRKLAENFWHNDTDFNLISLADGGIVYGWKTFSFRSIVPFNPLAFLKNKIFSGEKAQFKLFFCFAAVFGSEQRWKSIIVSCARLPLSMRERVFLFIVNRIYVLSGVKWTGREGEREGRLCLFADDAVFGANGFSMSWMDVDVCWCLWVNGGLWVNANFI